MLYYFFWITEVQKLHIKGKEKLKFILEQATKFQKGSRGIALFFI